MTSWKPIPSARPEFWGNKQQYVLQAIESTWISGGLFVDRLATRSEIASIY